MEFPPRALCVSLGARGVESVRDAVAALPEAVRFVELRADLLPRPDLEDSSWNP